MPHSTFCPIDGLKDKFDALRKEEQNMRTVLSFVFAVLLVAAFSQVTFGQGAPEGGPGMGPGPGGMQQGAGKEITPEQFSQMKAHALKMIEERRMKLDHAKACVQAAKNPHELRKCRPEPPMMGQGGHFPGGPGQERPPMEPMEKAD
jgi:hypothetical protein